MCHTLLHHYIHCRHSTVHFYPCTKPHPNYNPPPSDSNPHAYPAAAPIPAGGPRHEGKWVPPQWRDHSVPKSVAHSFHRVCPSCLDETRRKEQKEEAEREAKETLARTRGVQGWWDFAAQAQRVSGVRVPSSGNGSVRGHERGQVQGHRRYGGSGVGRGSREPATRFIGGAVFTNGLPLPEGNYRIIDGGLHEVLENGQAQSSTSGAIYRRPTLGPTGMMTGAVVRPPLPTPDLPLQSARRALQVQIPTPAEATDISTLEVDHVRRRELFNAAIASERRRIVDASAAMGMQPPSEEEMQRRFQPIRDLISAPPMLASLLRYPGSNRPVPAELAREWERQQGLWQPANPRIQGSGDRERRGAMATTNFAVADALNIIASVEAAGIDDGSDEEAVQGDDESVTHEHESLPELVEVEDVAQTAVQEQSRTRRSETPSPEERSTISFGTSTRHNDQAQFSLPPRSFCTEHQGNRRELIYHRPSHSRSEDEHTYPSKQLIHTNVPRTYNDDKENLCGDTDEILVHYEQCGHAEAVFLESLHCDREERLSAPGCGCEKFDLRLRTSRKAWSRQTCLHCRFGLVHDNDPVSEAPVWFGKHVRKIRNSREIGLWPFSARSNGGMLMYR